MAESLLVVNFLTAALQAGLNMSIVLSQISDELKAAHASGATLTATDLSSLFDQGDRIEKAAHEQFLNAIKDPTTPHA